MTLSGNAGPTLGAATAEGVEGGNPYDVIGGGGWGKGVRIEGRGEGGLVMTGRWRSVMDARAGKMGPESGGCQWTLSETARCRACLPRLSLSVTTTHGGNHHTTTTECPTQILDSRASRRRVVGHCTPAKSPTERLAAGNIQTHTYTRARIEYIRIQLEVRIHLHGMLVLEESDIRCSALLLLLR